jgi:predicted amidohydrolase YtcJ
MRLAAIFIWLLGAATLMYGQTDLYGPPDAVFYNGKVVTVDSGFSTQQAFAVRGEQFVAVGTNAKVRALAGKGTRLVDLHGRTVIPGLTDNHFHLQRAAYYVYQKSFLDMTRVTTFPMMMDRLRKVVKEANAKPGQLLIGSGGWDLREFPSERRGPTREELDQVAPQNPLILIRSRNLFFLNTAALKEMGVTRDTKDLAGDPILKDAKGDPTGAIATAKQLNAVIKKLFPPYTPEDNYDAMLKMQDDAVKVGLTSVRDLSLNPDYMRVYQDWRREGKLKLRVAMGLNTNDYGVPAPNAEGMENLLKPWGVGPGFGDGWLRVDSLAEITGAPNRPVEQLIPIFQVIQKYGWRPAIHISEEFLLGEAEKMPVSQIEQLDRVLAAYEAADKVKPIRPMRWVVEHVPQMRPDQMDRIAKLGILVSAQHGPYYDGPEMLKEWGRERADHVNPVREWLDHKIVVSSGTDWPGRDFNPLVTYYYFVTRKLPDGTQQGTSEKVTREEALRIATVNYAYTTFDEKIKGSIEPGKLADFLILSDDILTVPDEKLKEIHPLATFVGSRKVFSTPEGKDY